MFNNIRQYSIIFENIQYNQVKWLNIHVTSVNCAWSAFRVEKRSSYGSQLVATRSEPRWNPRNTRSERNFLYSLGFEYPVLIRCTWFRRTGQGSQRVMNDRSRLIVITGLQSVAPFEINLLRSAELHICSSLSVSFAEISRYMITNLHWHVFLW